MRQRRGTLLVALGVLLFSSTMVISAVAAPSLQVNADGADDRRTLVGSQGGGPGWHKYGSIYLLNGTNETWRHSGADSYFDATVLENGSVVAGFMDSGYQNCGPYNSPCTRTGFRVIEPASGSSIISEYSFPVRTQSNSEVHDVERLPTGEFLMTDMENERIFTVQNGEVTWQWNASEFYDTPNDATKTDWLHINDVDRIANGKFLISVRNANQLVIVERNRGVIEVINKDDDESNDASCGKRGQLSDSDGDSEFRCGDPTVINHQHNPQWLGDGAVLVADSDNDRIVELHRTDNGSWEPVWILNSAGGVSFDWPRDADRLPNGNTLITDTLNKRLVEVTDSGEVVWSVQTERIPYEADRLPGGEQVRGQSISSHGVENPDVRGDVPVLSLLLVGLRAVAPWTPFWFTEIQLFSTLLSTLLIVTGAIDWVLYWR